MQVFKSDIYKYLGGANCHYLIPIYQRAYSWEKEQCKRLWDDIIKVHKQKRDSYFIGSVVRIDEPAPAGTIRSMVIDGQ